MMWGLTSIVQHAPCQHVCAYCRKFAVGDMVRASQPDGGASSLDMFHVCCHCYRPIFFGEYGGHLNEGELSGISEHDAGHILRDRHEEARTSFSIDAFAAAYARCRKFVVRVSALNKAVADLGSAGNDNSLDASR